MGPLSLQVLIRLTNDRSVDCQRTLDYGHNLFKARTHQLSLKRMLKILYCNWCLVSRSGTEVVTIETVLSLQDMGHQVAVLVWHPGKPAEQLREAGIPVITSLDELSWSPDIVHSNHLPQSLQCAQRFPLVPQVFFCHDPSTAHSAPPRLPNILSYCAVDEVCAERTRSVAGEITLMHNAVDLTRFQRRMPLPDSPKSAVMLGKNIVGITAIHEACEELGISLDALGTSPDTEVTDLSKRLKAYDLVFAVARNAIESMATGCAVVVVDKRGLAGMVRSERVDEWRRHNFGKRLLTRASTREALVKEILSFDADDAAAVCQRIRDVASLDNYVLDLVKLYESVIAKNRLKPLDATCVRDAFPTAFRNAIPDLMQLISHDEMRQFSDSLLVEYQSLCRTSNGRNVHSFGSVFSRWVQYIKGNRWIANK